MERELFLFAVVALIAIAGIIVVAPQGATGAVTQIMETREYASLSQRLCPDPTKPVPVLVQRADIPGTTGKTQHVACVPAGTVIAAYGHTFFPEFNRKESLFAHGREKLREI